MPKLKLFVSLGQRIGRGVVIETDLRIPRPGRVGLRAAKLRCDCGNEYVSALQALVGERPDNQRCLSCGCLRRENQIAAVTNHGMNRGKHGRGPHARMQRHPLIKIWEGMLHRCEFPNDPFYYCYGGRGITVCKRWHDPRLFAEDIDRLLGPRPQSWTLDRIENDGNYEPGNVRWASPAMQAANRRRPDSQKLSNAVAETWVNREYRTVTCEQCRIEFQTRAVDPDVRFCSKKCKAKHRRDSGVDDIEKICHQCGGSFTRNRYDKVRHCSQSCAAKCQHAGNCPV